MTAASSTRSLIQSASSVAQGAEAKLYKVELNGQPVLLKHRFVKNYRHPSLDTSLTKGRVAGEARALIKCLKRGVSVPGIRFVDADEGVLGIEWIDGLSVRKILGGGAEAEIEGDGAEEEEEEEVDYLAELQLEQDALMKAIGSEIARMHSADIIHGDLTTSNMMIRRSDRKLLLIDFGLAGTSALVEDKAVDLYVLERAFHSTHAESEEMFKDILKAYKEASGGATWSAVYRRLEEGGPS